MNDELPAGRQPRTLTLPDPVSMETPTLRAGRPDPLEPPEVLVIERAGETIPSEHPDKAEMPARFLDISGWNYNPGIEIMLSPEAARRYQAEVGAYHWGRVEVENDQASPEPRQPAITRTIQRPTISEADPAEIEQARHEMQTAMLTELGAMAGAAFGMGESGSRYFTSAWNSVLTAFADTLGGLCSALENSFDQMQDAYIALTNSDEKPKRNPYPHDIAPVAETPKTLPPVGRDASIENPVRNRSPGGGDGASVS